MLEIFDASFTQIKIWTFTTIITITLNWKIVTAITSNLFMNIHLMYLISLFERSLLFHHFYLWILFKFIPFLNMITLDKYMSIRMLIFSFLSITHLTNLKVIADYTSIIFIILQILIAKLTFMIINLIIVMDLRYWYMLKLFF